MGLSYAAIFAIIAKFLIVLVASTMAAYIDSDEDGSVLAVVEPIAKLPVEGVVRKDYAKLHQIQERRTRGMGNRKTQGSGLCTFQGRIAIRNECEQYLACQRAGTKPTLGYCPKNKRFHHQLRQCLKMSEDECQATMCQTTMDKFPDPYGKENYLSCRGMFPALYTCPHRKIYDDEKKACVEGSLLTGIKSSSEADKKVKNRKDKDKPFVKND